LVRTLHILHERDDIEDLKEEFTRVSLWAMKYQKRTGLWNCFLDNEESAPDTSGSAGIAAAVAAGCSTGLLPYYLSTRAERTWEGLMENLTPDGFLNGVAQSNKGGEDLQLSDYRVISQMGMGLMGQLYAFL
jgi:rhamnogalacturonyl hydrolase YesR